MLEWMGVLCYIKFIFIILGSGLGWLYVVKICGSVGKGAYIILIAPILNKQHKQEKL
jgi:hypothetical protein